MEPVTHILTGACLARSGLNRRAAYTTAAMAIAAEFPDIDTLWGIRGPISGFQHHRGITHTFLGIPFEAGLLLAAFWSFHRWRSRRPTAESRLNKSAIRPAPVRWATLYGFILLALLSHILLDFTNNYCIRPFLSVQPTLVCGLDRLYLRPPSLSVPRRRPAAPKPLRPGRTGSRGETTSLPWRRVGTCGAGRGGPALGRSQL